MIKGILRRAAGSSPTPVESDEIAFRGDYASWAEAARDADGYDTPFILERVRDASRICRDRDDRFERDGVLFSEPQWNFALIACLLRVATERGGSLSVLDFGGALGSVYFQSRPFLQGISSLRWNVVEQPHFVACGREEFEDGTLRFFEDIASVLSAGAVDVALLSSVLPYLPAPYQTIEEVAAVHLPWLLVDRTPTIAQPSDRIVVQHVPAWVYGQAVRYPARIFAAQPFRQTIERYWSIVVDTEAIDRPMASGQDQVSFRLILAARYGSKDSNLR
jgi:putative methyltransferase (TIGR04325 family)